MAGSQVKREVVIELLLQNGKGSKAAVTQAKADIEALQKAATQSAAATTTAQVNGSKKVQNEQEKQAEKARKAIESLDRQRSRALMQEIKAQERAEKAEEKRIENIAKAQERAMRSLDNQRSRALAQEMKAKNQAAKAEEKRREIEIKREEIAAAKRQSELEKWQAASEGANRKVLESTKALTEALVQTGKGMAYLGLVSEETSQDVLRGIVAIEAVANIFKGTITTFTAIADIQKAVRAGTLAQAAANEILAASQLKVAATAVAGGVGSAAGGVASGAAAGAAGRFGFGMAAGAALPTLGKIAGGIGSVAAGAAVPLGAVAGGLALGEGISTLASGDGRGTIRTGIEAYSIYRQNQKTSAKIQAGQDQRQRRLDEAASRDDQIMNQAGMRSAQRARVEADARLRSELDPNSTALSRARDARARAASDVERSQLEAAQARDNDQKRKQSGQVYSYADQLQAAQGMAEAATRRRDAEMEINGILKDQLASRKAAVESAQAELQAAKDRYEAEQQVTKGKAAQFGKLGAGEQARLTDIAQRYQSGEELSRADIDALERSGLGGNIATDYWAKQGNAAGAQSVLHNLGERDAESEAFNEMQRAEVQVERARDKELQAAQELTESTRNLTEAIDKASRIFNQLENLQINQEGVVDPDVENSSGGVGNAVASMGIEIERAVNGVQDNMIRLQQQIAAAQPVV